MKKTLPLVPLLSTVFCSAAVLVFLCPALLMADIGLDVTNGPGVYQDSVLNLGANASKKINIGFGYEQACSTTSTTMTKTYSADLGYKAGEHWNLGLNVSNSPEANDTKSMGWGISAGYSSETNQENAGNQSSGPAETQNFTWGIGLAFNSTAMSEYIDYQTLKARIQKRKIKYVTVEHSQWLDLRQTDLDPSLTFGFFGIVNLNLGYSKYSYDRDVGLFSQRLSSLSGKKAVRNANVDGTLSSIDGFPDRIASAGIGIVPFENASMEYDWSRTVYVLDQPQEDSSTVSLSYTFWSMVNVKASYNVLAYRDTYTTLGLNWVW